MSLRAAALLDLVHADVPCPWLERLELLQFHGGLQLSVSQVVGPDCAPLEVWFSRECRRPNELVNAIAEWMEARHPTPAQAERAWNRCREALAEWGITVQREPQAVSTPRRAQARPGVTILGFSSSPSSSSPCCAALANSAASTRCVAMPHSSRL